MTTIRLTNYNMASARVIGGFLFAPALAYVFVAFIISLPTVNWAEGWQQALIMGLGAPLGAAAFAWMALTAVTSLTIGDVVIVGKVFGSKIYPVSAIEHIEFGSESTNLQGVIPVASHLMMHVLFPDRHVQVKLSQAEAQAVVAALEARGMGKVFQKQAS